MGRNMYIYFPGTKALEGSASPKEIVDKKAIELLSYSHGLSMPLSGASVGHQARHQGRSNHSDFTFSKYLDQSTPNFNQFCAGGNVIKQAVIALFHAAEKDADSKPVLFMEYQLGDVIISSVSVGGGGSDLPVETISLNYGTIQWASNLMDNKTGAGKGQVTTTWNLYDNTK